MKKSIKNSVALVLSVLYFLSSCQKNNELSHNISPQEYNRAEYSKNLVDDSINGEFEVKEGILHFRNIEAFQEVWNKYMSSNSEERKSFWGNGNFSSYASQYEFVIKQLAEATDKVNYDALCSENKHLIKVTEEGNIIPLLGDSFINNFINSEGLLYIGKMIYRFDNKQQKIAFDGKKTSLQNMQESKELAIFQQNSANIPNAKMASCTYFNTSKEEGGNRKATVSTETTSFSFPTGFNHLGQQVYTLKWAIRVKGVPQKKNVWGNWVNYSTNQTLKASFYFYVQYLPSVTPTPINNVVSKYVNCNFSNEGNEITHDDYIDITGLLDPNTVQAQQFTYLEKGGLGWNNYSSYGVSEFEYGCP